jgi:hypothetical protein
LPGSIRSCGDAFAAWLFGADSEWKCLWKSFFQN